MLNLHETIRSSPHFRKFEIGDLLFAQYTCPLEQDETGIWTTMDYVVHVISGRKTWRTIDGSWEARTGDTLFFRKGTAIVRQHFDADFCLLLFFLPDSFVRAVVREVASEMPRAPAGEGAPATAYRLKHDVALAAFFQSMLAYFAGEQPPSLPLLRLKLKELVVSLVAGAANPELAACLVSQACRGAPSVAEIMQANFRSHLSLAEYAALCHRSLSSFKRDFHQAFGEPPGKWLLSRRLDYARALLEQPGLTITEVVFESGFEDVSHFCRAFKARFGAAPSAFRSACA